MDINELEYLEGNIMEVGKNLSRDYSTLVNVRRKSEELCLDLLDMDKITLQKIVSNIADIDDLLYYVENSMRESIEHLEYQEGSLYNLRCDYLKESS